MRLRPVFSAMLLVPLTAWAWAQSDFLAPEALDAAGLTRFWQFQVPLDPNQSIVAGYLVDDAIYLATNDGYAVALDAYTGALRWLQPISGTAYRVRRPAHAGDKVVFVTPVDIQTYDRRSGDGIARRELRFPAGTGPVSDGTRVYFGGLDARLHCHDVESLTRDWRIGAEGPVWSTPVLFGNAVYCASQGKTVFAATRAQKAFRWYNVVGGNVSADLVANENGVYVACEDQSLYVFDLQFGRLVWRTLFGAPLREPPLPTKTLVFQYSQSDGLVAIEAGLPHEIEKRVRWTLPEGRQAVAVHDNTLYALSNAGELLAVDAKTGRVKQALSTGGLTIALPSAAEPTVYLASADGRLICLRPKGVPLLRAEEVRGSLGGKDDAAGPPEPDAARAPATQPAVAPGKPADSPPPVGGKSRISKGFRGGGS